MPKEFSRTRRVSELIRRELATVIAQEMHDPRARFVSITAVEVSKDLRNAKVYVTQLANDSEHKNIDYLQNAAGFLRKHIGKALNLKNIPALQFYYDSSVERGVTLSNLIEQAVEPQQEQ